MVSEQLQKKIDRAVKLLQSVANGYDGEIEVAYSGGKDSDVILQLAKESGIRYRSIYKNTTIDPPGTLKHVRDMGAEVIRPKKNFFELVADNGLPNRFARFCCKFLKEYKVLDKAIMGVRKAESTKRAAIYSEPTECRFYGSKKEHVEAIYPILDWTDEDVREFIIDRNIHLAPVYYDPDGTLHTERRLGCMCCPLASNGKRIAQFKEHPNMVKAYLRAAKKFRDNPKHCNAKTMNKYADIYEWFTRDVFFDRQSKFDDMKNGLFADEIDYKAFLEKQFGIDLTIQ